MTAPRIASCAILACALSTPALSSDSLSQASLPAAGIPSQAKPRTRSVWQVGEATFHPHAGYALSYSDGLLSRPGHPTNTYSYVYSGGVGLDLGDNWVFDYTRTWTDYSNRAFHRANGQDFTASDKFALGEASVRFSEEYHYSTEVLFETGRQTIHEVSTTALGASYRLGSKSLIDLSAVGNVEFLRAAADPVDYLFSGFLRYSLTRRLVASAGAGLGYLAVHPGPDMTYFRPSAQLNWQPTEKFGLGLSAGTENRKFYAHQGATILNSPTLGASWDYKPFEQTRFSATARQDISTSYFSNQLVRGQRWSLALQQRLLGHVNLTATYSGGATRFVESQPVFTPFTVVEEVVDEEGNVGEITSTGFTVSGVRIKRKDSVHSLEVGLSSTLRNRLVLSAGFRRSRNISNAVGFGSTVKQYTLSVSAKL